jgi:mannose-6-phosphate isomerase-like protein (cupin superfamily)
MPPLNDFSFTDFKQYKFRILKTGKETNGEYDLFEYEYFPKEKNKPSHFHTDFTEKFTIVKGMMILEIGKEFKLLTAGESYTMSVNQAHSFFNHTSETVRFTTEIRPSSESFVKAQIIRQGLWKDGLCRNNGIPKKLSHFAVLTRLSKTYTPGLNGIVQRFIMRRSNSKKIRKIEAELIKKYYNPYL